MADTVPPFGYFRHRYYTMLEITRDVGGLATAFFLIFTISAERYNRKKYGTDILPMACLMLFLRAITILNSVGHAALIPAGKAIKSPRDACNFKNDVVLAGPLISMCYPQFVSAMLVRQLHWKKMVTTTKPALGFIGLSVVFATLAVVVHNLFGDYMVSDSCCCTKFDLDIGGPFFAATDSIIHLVSLLANFYCCKLVGFRKAPIYATIIPLIIFNLLSFPILVQYLTPVVFGSQYVLTMVGGTRGDAFLALALALMIYLDPEYKNSIKRRLDALLKRNNRETEESLLPPEPLSDIAEKA